MGSKSYSTNLDGMYFDVSCTNSVTGTYPNAYLHVAYTIKLKFAGVSGNVSYNGAVVKFGGNSHTVNFDHHGTGSWTIATGTLDYKFGTSRTKTQSIAFSTSFGNVSSSGSQEESVTIAMPSAGKVTHGTPAATSCDISWSGFSFGKGATFGKYQISFDNKTWTDCGTNTSRALTNLKGETNYTVYVRLVDNFGGASSAVSTSFTTLVDQVKAYFKLNGEWKRGKLYAKLNGEWKRVKYAWAKSNGEWKRSV